MKNTIYKFTLVIELILLIPFYFLKEHLFIDDLYDVPIRPSFYPYDLYFSLFIPTILLCISFLLAYIFNGITSAGSNQEKDHIETNEFKNNDFLKFSFYANLCACASLILIFVVFFWIMKIKTCTLSFVSDYPMLNFIFVLLLFVFNIIIGTLFLSIKSLWKTNRLVSFILVIISLLIFISSLAFVTFILLEQKHRSESISTSASEEEVTETDVVSTESEYSEADEIVNDDRCVFSDTGYGYTKTENYFSDLWDNPEKDKENTAYVIKTFFTKYLELRKTGTISDVKSNYGWGINNIEDEKVQQVINKISSKPERILEAFKSYKFLLYYILSPDVYERSGLEIGVKVLLRAHKDLYESGDHDENVADISKLMKYTKVNYEVAHEYYDVIQPYLSDDLFDILQSQYNEGEMGKRSNPSIEAKGTIVWAYSFWARRYVEHNKDIVYQVLEEINDHYDELKDKYVE
jgi:hypothetical protein